jgi:endonuclease/exonuclease/phosphatase family metal-dependent hydrolase
MAREIERARPHVVGLQEVSRIDITLPPIDPRGPAVGAGRRDQRPEFHGEHRAGCARGRTDAWVGVGQDRDRAPGVHRRQHTPRVRDAPGLDQLRAAQATELAQALSGPGPIILMGDLNDVPGSPMHQVLSGAGLMDVWSLLRGTAVGYTCCHLPNLSNPEKHFTKRIDYVFVRDGRERGAVTGVIQRIGDAKTDRFAGPLHPLWASDHAGLVARLDTHQPRP